jgi:hypothetical protein
VGSEGVGAVVVILRTILVRAVDSESGGPIHGCDTQGALRPIPHSTYPSGGGGRSSGSRGGGRRSSSPCCDSILVNTEVAVEITAERAIEEVAAVSTAAAVVAAAVGVGGVTAGRVRRRITLSVRTCA